jgi:hypothetical protein
LRLTPPRRLEAFAVPKWIPEITLIKQNPSGYSSSFVMLDPEGPKLHKKHILSEPDLSRKNMVKIPPGNL